MSHEIHILPVVPQQTTRYALYRHITYVIHGWIQCTVYSTQYWDTYAPPYTQRKSYAVDEGCDTYHHYDIHQIHETYGYRDLWISVDHEMT